MWKSEGDGFFLISLCVQSSWSGLAADVSMLSLVSWACCLQPQPLQSPDRSDQSHRLFSHYSSHRIQTCQIGLLRLSPQGPNLTTAVPHISVAIATWKLYWIYTLCSQWLCCSQFRYTLGFVLLIYKIYTIFLCTYFHDFKHIQSSITTLFTCLLNTVSSVNSAKIIGGNWTPLLYFP